jgi:glycerophosphoryl diester phosphodiesterase
VIIISHRGLWTLPSEKNSPRAFAHSFESGFGLETDVRDLAGALVISHDPPSAAALTLDDFLSIPGQAGLPLALNIKADGLAADLVAALRARDRLDDAFVFDMSVPDMRHYLDAEIAVYTRLSEAERTPAWFDRCEGVWLDAFESTWFDVTTVEDLLAADKRVCVVSPELHGRAHEETWRILTAISPSENLMLCTDLPQEARNYF